ncbi:MAG: tetratricopeptide repeat protein [Pseudorhodoplanes sp.]|uniref:tetratricopeptide repeat protein n=1 Tax=Pseudorhodoplanes sp. TaxID=1934341 RepID=UPI003D119831
MTRVIQRITLCSAVAVITAAVALTAPARAAAIEEPAKPAASPADKKDDDKKEAKPATDSKAPDAKPEDQKPADKKSDLDFRRDYWLAYDAIYRRQDYVSGLAMLRSLGHDDHPDVANLIGFASRKLGRTEEAKLWYEKALAADPRHSRTWQYYGMLHLERGDRAKAEEHLERIRLICGQGCEDYASLRAALNGHESY